MPIIEGFTPSGRSQNEAPRALEGFTSVYKVPMRGGDDASGMRNPLQFLNDTVVTTVNSGLGIIKGVSDFVSVDNPLSKGLEYIIKEGEETYSPQVKQAEEELGQAMDEGGFDAVKGVGKYVLSSPVQTAAKIVGGFGPIGKAVKYSTVGAKSLGLGARGQGITGLGTGATLGGAAAGGDAASDAYSQVMNSPNVPEDQREAMARQAARQASVVPAILGGLSGATGLERIMSGARGITREGVRRTAGKEFLTEGIEEGGTKASANIAAMQYDPTIDPMRGVVGATTLGGIMGAGGGAGVAYLNNRAYESNILGTANPSADQKTMLGINPGAGLSVQELIDRNTGVDRAGTYWKNFIDENAGSGSKALAAREADIRAALDEPSGRYAVDENGLERELTMGEAASLGYETPALGTLTSAEAPSGETTSQVIGDDLQAAASKVGLSLVGSRGKPNVKRIEAFTKAVDLLGSGAIDRAMFDQTVEQLKKGRYAEATKSFAQVEADFQEKQRLANQPKFQRAPKPEDQNVSTDISATGGLAPSVDVGGVDVSGGLAATGSALALGPNGDVGSRVAGISPAGNETSLLGNVASQPSTPVISRKRRITFDQPQQGQAFVAPETTTEQDQGLPAEQSAQTSLEDQLAIGELTGNTAETQALTEESLGQREDTNVTDEAVAQAIDQILDKTFEKSKDKVRDIEIAKAYLVAMKGAPENYAGRIQEIIGQKYQIGPEAVRKIGNTTNMVNAAVSMGMTEAQARNILGVVDTAKGGVSTTAGAKTGGLEDALTAVGVESAEGATGGFGYDDTRTWAQGVKGVGDTLNVKDEALANAINTIAEKIEQLEALAQEVPAIADQLKAEITELEAKQAAAMEKYAAFLSGKKKPTKAKKDTKAAALAEPTEQKAATSELTGRDVWEQLREDMPGLNSYGELTKSEKGYLDEVAARTGGDFTLASEPSLSTVIENNMDFDRVADDTASEMYTEDFEADDGTARYSKSATSQEWKDNDGNTFKTQPTTLSKLTQYTGITNGLKHLQKAGLISTAQNIESWLITSDNVPWDGMFALVDGKPTIIFSQAALNDQYTATITLMHEVGHGADNVIDGQGGTYSSAPELNLTFNNGKLRPVGAVAREVYNHFINEPDSPLSQMMVYPFVDNKGLNSDTMREEIFAQLYAFNGMEQARLFLKDNLPLTAAFMERTNAKIKKANTSTQAVSAIQGAQSGQVQAGVKPQEINGRQLRANKEKILNSDAAKKVSNTVSKTLNAVVFTEDLFKRAVKSGIAAAKKMDTIYRERTNLEGQIERDVERVASLYNKIPVKERGTGDASANKYVYDMTREKKWGFEPTWRTGTSEKVKIDPAMSKRWDGLSQESRDWIEAVFAHGDQMLKLKKQTLMDATNSEYDALIKDAQAKGDTKKVAKFQADKKAQLAQFARLFAVSEFNPYAPMKRFGNYVVIAKSQKYLDATPAEQAKLESDPDNYHVSFAESTASALELQRELEGTKSFAEVVAREKEDPSNRMYGGLMQAFNKLRGDLDAELSNVTDPKEREALSKARAVVADLYLAALAENSSRKAEMRRKGVAGEIDMLRSFATQGRADAQFLATAKYSPQMTEAINEMRRETKSGGDQLEKSQLFNEIMARHNQSLSYDNSEWSDIASKASRVTSVWMLATSPMYYLQNLTQPVMLSVPFMAGRHNYFKAQAALLKSYTQLGGLNKNKKIDEPLDFDNVPADVRKMISTLVDRGRIDIGMETELGQFQVAGESKTAQGINKVDRVLRSVGQKMEAINRVSTAIAAYRLELAKTGSIKDATEYADNVISQTHGDYTRTNAPRVFNTNIGKVALQFRKFQLIQLTLLTKLVANSVKGGTKAERTAARKALAFTLGHTAALAGLVGMPGFAAISFILKGLADTFGDDEEPYNLEKELYEAMVDQWGEDAATLIMRGAPAAAGIDLSGKLGMGNALSVLPFTDFELSKAGVAEAGFAMTFGASGALAQRFADGLKLISGGEYQRGLEKLAPKGVSDAMKAVRENDEGVTRLNGDVLVPADEIAAWESTAKFFGVPVTSDTKRRFLTDIKFENEKAFKDKAAKLKNQYTKARREGDDTTAVREKWAKLQDERVSEGFKREPLSNLLQAPQAQAKRERETAGGIQFNKQTRRFTEELVGEQ
jgi:hypothetical protein